MKKLMFATALVASAAAFADGPTALNAISFEGYTAGYTFTNGTAENDESGNAQSGNGYFYYQGDQDGSSVKAFGGENVAAPSITRPAYFAGGAAGSNYLDLSTEGGTLWRSINAIEQGGTQEDPTWSLGTAQAVGADGIYLDTLVQFTPTEDGGAPETEAADKLAIWLNVDGNGVTNLQVKAAVIDLEGAPLAPTTFTITNKSVNAGQWYRLTIKAIPDIAGSEGVPGFQIKLDGQLLMSDTPTMTAGTISLLDGYTDYITDIRNGAVFASLGGINDNPTLQGVGFKGSGALDDIVWTTDDLFAVPAGIDFTLTWPSGLTAVSYAIGNGEPVAISGSSPFSVPGLAADDVVKFIVQNADGAKKTLTGTAGTDSGIDATGTTFTWADYLGDAVDGAYEIDDLAELILFQKGVAADLETANTTFKLTDDVTLTAPWPGIGMQNGKDILCGDGDANPPITADPAAFAAASFRGTFDGQNHTISGFQMQGGGLDYCGFFNSIAGATIQNLKIQYAGALFAADTTASTAESGATFVGVITNSTLRNLTSLQKDASTAVSCSKGFGGIAGYLTAGSTVEYCTNNVNLTSLKPNKAGGIVMITQGGSGSAVVRNCLNNGTTTGNTKQKGGLIGYIGTGTTIENCEVTSDSDPTFFSRNGGTVTVNGVNKAPASVLPSRDTNAKSYAVDGLSFATVDNGIATFVKNADLAAGNEYKVMATNVTATYAFTVAGTIAFDTAFFTPTYAITAAEGLTLTDATAGTVTTYTAAAAGGDDYVVEIEGSDVVITPQAGDLEALAEAGVDTNSVAAVNAALATTIEGTSIPAWQALFLGVAPTTNGLEWSRSSRSRLTLKAMSRLRWPMA